MEQAGVLSRDIVIGTDEMGPDGQALWKQGDGLRVRYCRAWQFGAIFEGSQERCW